MKFVITHDTRKGDNQGVLNNQLYDSFDQACDGLRKHLTDYDNGVSPPDCDKFGGQISKGTYYSEEESLEVIELNE